MKLTFETLVNAYRYHNPKIVPVINYPKLYKVQVPVFTGITVHAHHKYNYFKSTFKKYQNHFYLIGKTCLFSFAGNFNISK